LSEAVMPLPTVNEAPAAAKAPAPEASAKAADSPDPSDIFQMYFKKK
jgi:hypothetical protein